MPQANGPGTKAAAKPDQTSSSSGPSHKKKRNRRRNKNKKKLSVVDNAPEPQKEVGQKNDLEKVEDLKIQNNTYPEAVDKVKETPNYHNEVKTEKLLVKDMKQALMPQRPTGGDIAAKSPEQMATKNNTKQAKKQPVPNQEALGITLPKTPEQAKTNTTDVNADTNLTSIARASVVAVDKNLVLTVGIDKSREQVKADREAKKLAKQAKKQTSVRVSETLGFDKSKIDTTKAFTERDTNASSTFIQEASVNIPFQRNLASADEKFREQIKTEIEANKLTKLVTKTLKQNPAPVVNAELVTQIESLKILETIPTSNPQSFSKPSDISDDKKKPSLTKAERRAVQEAQRAVKVKALQKKIPPTASNNATLTKKTPAAPKIIEKSSIPTIKQCIAYSTKTHDCKVKLFNHLESARTDVNLFVNNSQIHPIIARLGEQYSKRTIVGSNARCIAFLNALKIVIQDFETPPKKEFSRSLESFIKNCVDYLHKCRPLAVSVRNAYKHIKHILTQLSTVQVESDIKENLCHFIDTYLENQIGKAALAISCSMQEKISNGDVILTFGCSSLINYIFEEAHRRHVDFRVIVIDSRPFCEGQELLRRLCAKGIPSTYVLINAVSFVMPEVTKILLGAHALLSNGYVMARAGTAQVALVARSFNVPVLVCCETHKFSERFQTDAIVYNELGNPDDLILSEKCCLTNWHIKNKLSPLNLNYDITPPELVTAVVTEVSILPCTSVPVILRIKPTEIGYYN